MPVYEYQCQMCGKLHEIMQRYTDAPLTKCPECGGEMKKLISNTSFVLKGAGWYKTDYASGGSRKAAEGEKGNGAKPEKKSEAKSEPKIETASKA
ncbi:MAG: zinc ribbon domain-containing protein [Nitrospirae bacterium]|nr:zinc ribbon domain-containing protein [Nitrospirota bacterium]MCL5422288.1 zinc ribbon domain-containing protein [Nitrospirota bacterium]